MIKIAFFASAFINRNAAGTAQVIRKMVEYLLVHESKRFNTCLITRNIDEVRKIQNDPILSRVSIICLPEVKGKFLRTSRQYYKYSLINRRESFDILFISVARVFPFYWFFPAKKFHCLFYAGGEITAPTDKFILSRSIFNFIMKAQWKHLDSIFAISDFGQKEISINYKIPLSKISIIPIGADHLWNLESSKIQIRRDVFNIVVIGRWQLYKNVHSVLLAIAHSSKIDLKKIHITLLGKSDKTGFELVTRALSQIPRDKVTILEYVTDSELKYLYSSANLVIHPSINEGFGLPAFEAYGEGVPIVIHQGTPAAENLNGEPGVLITNMLDFTKIEETIIKSLNLKFESIYRRRKYLRDKSMTWNHMCHSYVDYFVKNHQ